MEKERESRLRDYAVVYETRCNEVRNLKAELAAANKRIKELDDMYLKLSQKYADLYEKRK
jgi:hypothetical protein